MEFTLHRGNLTDITVEGIKYKLNMYYNNILLLSDMLEDVELSDIDKIDIGLMMLLGEDFDVESYEGEEGLRAKIGVFNQLMKSIFKKEEEELVYDISGEIMPSTSSLDEEDVVDYCLNEDAKYIYASFLQCYGIDLFNEKDKMHWETFNALLLGLSSETKFMQVLEIRGKELPTGKGSGEERERLIRLKNKYRLKGKKVKNQTKE